MECFTIGKVNIVNPMFVEIAKKINTDQTTIHCVGPFRSFEEKIDEKERQLKQEHNKTEQTSK